MAHILIIDDDDGIRRSLKDALGRRDHDVVTAETLARGREFASKGFDLILLDVFLPDGNGLDLLKDLLARDPDQVVVMVSGQADIETAVDAVRLGAFDFIEKPLSLERVLLTIDNSHRLSRLTAQNARLSQAVYGNLVGDSEPIRRLRDDVARSAGRTDRFLITGENGTGKELIAHMIHQSGSFARGPFVAVNCGAIPRDLIESELFGHIAGAFSGAMRSRKGRFAEAVDGTLFLDEIAELTPDLQVKLLRVLESRRFTSVGSDKEQTFTGNIVAATNRDLKKEIEARRFRQDLYYRINVVAFSLPPLRERREDIAALAAHFLQQFSTRRPLSFDERALALLRRLPYPGNVRELKNLIERVAIYADSPVVDAALIRRFADLPLSEEPPSDLKSAVALFERKYIQQCLSRHAGNVSQAARELGLERSHLYKKLKKLDLDQQG